MPISPRERADFPTALPKSAARARLEGSLGSWPRSHVDGWVSEYGAVLVVFRVFRSGYVFDGGWAYGPDGAHLVGEFRPARYSWIFYLLTIGMFTLTDFAVPAPRTSDVQLWVPVMLQRLAWLAGVIGLMEIGGRLFGRRLWNTIVKSDVQVIREHMKATFSQADV